MGCRDDYVREFSSESELKYLLFVLWIIRDHCFWIAKMVSEENYKIGNLNRKTKCRVLMDED